MLLTHDGYVYVIFRCPTDEEFTSKLAKNNFRYACIGRTIYDVRGSKISLPDCSGFEVVITAPLRPGEAPRDATSFLPPELGMYATRVPKDGVLPDDLSPSCVVFIL